MAETVLAIAAHGDDETLGCGGTLARHVAAGDRVHVLLLADGVTARNGHAEIDKRNGQAYAAARELGVEPPTMVGFKDNRLDAVALLDVVKTIEGTIREVSPSVVYTHHAGDLNVDHSIVHRATLTACRPLPEQTVRAIYGFEIPSSTGWAGPEQARAFIPNHYIEITDFLDLKLRALVCYESELRPFPHARSLEAVQALARWRGSEVGVRAAEAFSVLRQVRRR